MSSSLCLDLKNHDTFCVLAHLSLLLLHRAVQMVCREAGGGEEVLEELVGQKRSEENRGLWRNLRLDWVRNWDQSCQTAVLLSRLQHTGIRRFNQSNDPSAVPKSRNSFCVFGTFHGLQQSPCFLSLCVFVSLELSSCDSAMLWRYLTALHDRRRVVDWIDWNSETSGASWWPELTPELVNNNTVCSTYMRENILDLLARCSHHFHLSLVSYKRPDLIDVCTLHIDACACAFMCFSSSQDLHWPFL